MRSKQKFAALLANAALAGGVGACGATHTAGPPKPTAPASATASVSNMVAAQAQWLFGQDLNSPGRADAASVGGQVGEYESLLQAIVDRLQPSPNEAGEVALLANQIDANATALHVSDRHVLNALDYALDNPQMVTPGSMSFETLLTLLSKVSVS